MDAKNQKAVLYNSTQAAKWRDQALDQLNEERKKEGNTVETVKTSTTRDPYGRVISVKQTAEIETQYTYPKLK